MSATITAPERWLEKMAEEDPRSRQYTHRLWWTMYEARRWVFATNGYVLLMEKSEAEAEPWTDALHHVGESGWPHRRDVLDAILYCGTDSHLARLGVEELRAFAGEPVYPHGNGCEACGGDGVGACTERCPDPADCWEDHDCPDCGAEGVDLCPAVAPGMIGGFPFDRRKLAQVLAEMDAAEVDVYVRPLVEMPMGGKLLLRTRHQIGVLSGLSPEVLDRTHDGPMPALGVRATAEAAHA